MVSMLKNTVRFYLAFEIYRIFLVVGIFLKNLVVNDFKLNDEMLFVLISLFGSFLLGFGMISSRQKIQMVSVLTVAFGQEDTPQTNIANVLVDGWHTETRYDLDIQVAVIGGDIAVSTLTTTKPLSSVIADNTNGMLAMPKEADAGGTGGQVSAMAQITPSTVFIDPAMAIGTNFHFTRKHYIEVNKTERMRHIMNFGSQNATISAGTITITAIAIILIGAYLRGGRKKSQGTEVVIHAVDIGNTLKFGAWRAFCDGRIGNIRLTCYGETFGVEETLFFGPDVGLDIPQAEEDAEIVLMPSGNLIALPITVQDEEQSYIYATTYKRGPWFVKRDQAIPWAMDHSEGTPTRIMIEFTFIPDFGAQFQWDYVFTDVEIGTPDFEEFFVFPFDCFVDNIESDIGIVGTIVGIVVVEFHIFPPRAKTLPVFVGSEKVLDGNLLGDRNNVMRVSQSTRKVNSFLEVFPRETASGVFTAVDTKETFDDINEEYDAGSGIAIYAQALDATTVSFINGDITVNGRSMVSSKNFGANFMESDALVAQDTKS